MYKTVFRVSYDPVTLRVIARLTDGYGNPLQGKIIDFYYSYNGVLFNYIDSDVTDYNGTASVEHVTDKRTWYRAVLLGDDIYDGSSAITTFTPRRVVLRPLMWRFKRTVYIYMVRRPR